MRIEMLSSAVLCFIASAMMADSDLGLGLGPVGPLPNADQIKIQESVQSCWNVASLSRKSIDHILIVQFNLTAKGHLESRTTIVSATSSSAEVVDDLFRAACDAILCAQASGGFSLPVDNYEQWKTLELVFDPSLTPSRKPVVPYDEMEMIALKESRECQPVGNS